MFKNHLMLLGFVGVVLVSLTSFARVPVLGVRNNNPLNIRYSSSNNWLGQTGSNRGFCVFASPEYGFRAAAVLVRNYYKSGYTSISEIIRRWAPPTENDTKSYIDGVMEIGGFRTSFWPIDIDDDEEVGKLLYAMARIETGKNYDRAVIGDGLKMV